jgi:hypothetical protein
MLCKILHIVAHVYEKGTQTKGTVNFPLWPPTCSNRGRVKVQSYLMNKGTLL